ncbi:hypothetical protein L7F22_023423 [Adiantum nelumboides]|nr:hypothetical protein [Adiantum nelumboides]
MITMDPRTGTANYPTIHDMKPSYIDAHRLFPGVTTLWRPSQHLIPHGEQLEEVHASNGDDSDTIPLFIAQAGGPYHLPQLNEYISSSNMTNSVNSTSPGNNIVHPQVLSKAHDGSRKLDVNCLQHDAGKSPPTINMHILNSLKSGSPFPATSEYQDELMDDNYVHENPFPGPLPDSFRELLLQEGGINVPDPKHASTDPSSPQNPCSQINVDTLMAGMHPYYHALQVGMSSHPASCDGSLNQALSVSTIAKHMQKDYSYMEQMRHPARPAAPQGKIKGLSSCGAARLSKFKGCDNARGVNQRSNMVESLENSRGQRREAGEGIATNSINITRPKNQLGPDEKTCKNNMSMASIEQHILAAARADQKARVQSGGSFSNVQICFGQGANEGLYNEDAGGAESGPAEEEMEVLNLGELQDAFIQLVDQQQPAALLHAQLHAACKRGNVVGSAGASNAATLALHQVDLVTMLEKAINYVKFLQLQLKVLTDDEFWSNAQQMMQREADYSSMFEKGVIAEGNSSLESSSVLSKKYYFESMASRPEPMDLNTTWMEDMDSIPSSLSEMESQVKDTDCIDNDVTAVLGAVDAPLSSLFDGRTGHQQIRQGMTLDVHPQLLPISESSMGNPML